MVRTTVVMIVSIASNYKKLAECVALPMSAECITSTFPMLAEEWVALPIEKWRTSSIACPDAAVPELLSTKV